MGDAENEECISVWLGLYGLFLLLSALFLVSCFESIHYKDKTNANRRCICRKGLLAMVFREYVFVIN